MRLMTLTIENFQGIKQLSIALNGNNTTISGANGTGKTTVCNAFTWLLFGKPSVEIPDFSPKPKDEQGNDVHYLSTKVEGVFILDDGTLSSFAKVMSENWREKRGQAHKDFVGNTTQYFIDGVPLKESEYKETIERIVTPEQAKILTMPGYFASTLHWTKRREILLDVCGNITDLDIIRQTPELTPLETLLLKPGSSNNYYTIDEYMKIVKSRKAAVNTERDNIPKRIDEANLAIPDLDDVSLSEVEQSIVDLEQQRAALERQKSDASPSMSPLQDKIAQLEIKLNQAKSAHIKSENEKTLAWQGDLNEWRRQRSEVDNEIKMLTHSKQRLVSTLELTQKSRQSILDQYKTEKNKIWAGDTVCYACGQSLPAAEVEKAIEKFNVAKQQKLDQLKQRAETECSKAIIQDMENKIQAVTNSLAAQTASLTQLDITINGKMSTQPKPTPFETTDIYNTINAEINALKHDITLNDTTTAYTLMNQQISDIQQQVRQLVTVKAKFAMAEMQRARIEQLEQQERELGDEFDRLEHSIHLCETFTRVKASMLTQAINSKFSSVSFSLFQTQVNGGIAEECTVLAHTKDGLQPYPLANHAAAVNAGVEIINVLSQHWGVSMPLFVDGRESVTNLIHSDNQVISLFVRPECDRLCVEADDREEVA